MAIKDLGDLDVQVLREAVRYMRKSMVRNKDQAKSENVRAALAKDIESLDRVAAKLG